LLERYRLDLVVMTREAKGAILVSTAETIDQPGIPTTVRDTVGAGDAFTAVLICCCRSGFLIGSVGEWHSMVYNGKLCLPVSQQQARRCSDF